MFFSVKRLTAKKKEGVYRPLVDAYLHSWYVVHVDMEKNIYIDKALQYISTKLFKNSFYQLINATTIDMGLISINEQYNFVLFVYELFDMCS